MLGERMAMTSDRYWDLSADERPGWRVAISNVIDGRRRGVRNLRCEQQLERWKAHHSTSLEVESRENTNIQDK